MGWFSRQPSDRYRGKVVHVKHRGTTQPRIEPWEPTAQRSLNYEEVVMIPWKTRSDKSGPYRICGTLVPYYFLMQLFRLKNTHIYDSFLNAEEKYSQRRGDKHE